MGLPEHRGLPPERVTRGERLSRPGRMRKGTNLLERVGPRPVLLARCLAHGAATRMRQRVLRRTYGRTIAAPRQRASLVPATIDLPLHDELPPPLHAAAQRLRTEAESILAHRFDLLGSGPVTLGDRIDWQVDFKSGYRWPLVYHRDVEVTRLTDQSDAKVPWELSRGHHLVTLARAARIFDDARFADELENQLSNWLAANPPGYGINWANPMEVALRAVNWVAAFGTLDPWRPLRDPLRADVTRSLQIHGRHIAANLEGSPYLRSNHYLADILGLLVLGASLDGDAHSKRWFRRAHAAFETEIHTQVHEDGVGFEASLSYHAFALEMFLIAKLTADKAGRPFSAAFHSRLEAMLEATRGLRHPDGRLPQIGDCDSGRVLPAGFEREPTADHLLSIGAALFGRQRLLPGVPHEEVAWTLGVSAWKAVAGQPVAALPVRSAFPAAGYYVLRSAATHVVVRCGDVGQNGNGGHAHNDLLSFELSHGRPLVVDSGTYVYTSDPSARNLFRSTAAHNTVVVAAAEINPIRVNELFRLKQVANATVERWEETGDRVRLVASHDGYQRLKPSVSHRREYVLEQTSNQLEITEELQGEGRQQAETFLHFAAGAVLTETRSREWEVRLGDVICTVRFDGVDSVRLLEGWVSNRYGVRERAPALVAGVEGPLPLKFGYRIELPLARPAAEDVARTG
jgi:hypothetical protein